MTEMVERVARAIWDKRCEMAANFGIQLEDWGDGTIPRANHVFEEARAAIEAMREPTDAMVKAGMPCCDWNSGADDAYSAMIDAALKAKGNPHPPAKP